MKKKILFVLTSHSKLGDTGNETGFYLSEAAHPWAILDEAGYEIDFVSPKGGKAPVDGFDLDDPINKQFWETETYREKIENTLKPSNIKPEDYVAIHYVGGHGTMWDFADNDEIAKIAAKIYQQDGIVSAVCHGPAGLLNIKLDDGKHLIDGKKVTGFTNDEEHAVELEDVVPFMLESELRQHGGLFENAGNWHAHVTVDERLITGQNPQSAEQLGHEILGQLQKLEADEDFVHTKDDV